MVDLLSTLPMPVAGDREPTVAHAKTEMDGRFRQFLAREPYIRPNADNLPDIQN
jgi:hypothetical protein